MDIDTRKLKRKRHFSEQIRRRVVREFRAGRYTVRELSDLYQVSTTAIYKWIHKYSPADAPPINVVEMADSTDQKVKDLQDRIAELQQKLGQKQIKLDFYEKMLEQAKTEYNIDLKKILLGRDRLVSGPSGATEPLVEHALPDPGHQQAGRLGAF